MTDNWDDNVNPVEDIKRTIGDIKKQSTVVNYPFCFGNYNQEIEKCKFGLCFSFRIECIEKTKLKEEE